MPICIKEYFFKDYCYREAEAFAVKVHSETGRVLFDKFKEKLIKEAKILSEVHHPHIAVSYTHLDVYKRQFLLSPMYLAV